MPRPYRTRRGEFVFERNGYQQQANTATEYGLTSHRFDMEVPATQEEGYPFNPGYYGRQGMREEEE